MDIKDIELTEEDFTLLVEGLEELGDKDQARRTLKVVMAGLVGGEEGMMRVKTEQETIDRRSQGQRERQREDVKILQGKLLMLKRYLMEQDVLKKAKDILKNQ